jgi:hypothetical protein
MLGLGGFPLSWPFQDHKRPLSFRGLLSATEPKGDLQDSRSRPSMFELTGWPIKLRQPVLKDG